MSFSVYAPSPSERELALRLRETCLAEIDKQDPNAVCHQLGFERPALEELIWEPRWDLRIAFRVAEGLGLRIVPQLVDTVRQDLRKLKAV